MVPKIKLLLYPNQCLDLSLEWPGAGKPSSVMVVVVVVVVVMESDETILAIQLGGYNTKRAHVCPKEYITRARKQL
jgi:hypothetical protein